MSRRGARGRTATRKWLGNRKITKDMLKLKLFAMGFARKSAMETNCATAELRCVDDNTSSSPLESSSSTLRCSDPDKVSSFDSIFTTLPFEKATESWSVPLKQGFLGENDIEQNRQSLNTSVSDIAVEDEKKPLDSAFTLNSDIFSKQFSNIGVVFEPKCILSFGADSKIKCKSEYDEKSMNISCQVPLCTEAQKTFSNADIERYFKNVPFCTYQPTVTLDVLSDKELKNIALTSLKGEEPLKTESETMCKRTCRVVSSPTQRLRGSRSSAKGSDAPQVSSHNNLHLQTESLSVASQQSSFKSNVGVPVEQCRDSRSTSHVRFNSFPMCSPREESHISKPNANLETSDCAENLDAADVMLSRDSAMIPVLQGDSATGLEKQESLEMELISSEQTVPAEALQLQMVPPSKCLSSSSADEDPRLYPKDEHLVDPAPPATRRASLRLRETPLDSADEPVRKRQSSRLSLREQSGVLSVPGKIASGGEDSNGPCATHFSGFSKLPLPRTPSCYLNGTSKAPVMSRPGEHSKPRRGRTNRIASHGSSSAATVRASPFVTVKAAQRRPANPLRKIRLPRLMKKGSNSSCRARTGLDFSTTVPAAQTSITILKSSEESLLNSVFVCGSLEATPSSRVCGPLQEDSSFSECGPLGEGVSTSECGPSEESLSPSECGPLSTPVDKAVEEGPSNAVNKPLGGVSSGSLHFSKEESSNTTAKLETIPEVGRDHLDRRGKGCDEAEEYLSCVWCGEEYSSLGEVDKHSLSHAEPLDDYSADFCSDGTLVARETPGLSNVTECGGVVSEKELPFGNEACLSLSAPESDVIATTGTVFAHHSSETVIVGTERSAFQCLDCSLSFLTASGRRAHMITEHAQEVSITCQLCGYVSGSEPRYEHHCAVSHSVFRFKCSTCSDLFMSSELLALHKFSQHKAKDCHFFCPVCNILSPSPTFITHHIRTEHKGSFPYSCWCGQVFDNLLSFRAHAAMHAEELFKLHCDVCFLWCPTRELLNAHMASKHSQVLPYCCPLCGECHSSLVYLSRHVRLCHPDSEAYVCDSCGARFTSPLIFWNHVITKGHMVERVAYLYKCRECSLISFDRFKIAEHEEIEHAGILPLERATKLFSLLKEVN